MRVINIAEKLKILAGAEKTEDLYKVPSAQVFTLKRVIFDFPVGAEFNVGLAIRKGIKNVCPDKGLVYGDAEVIELEDNTKFVSGEPVSLYYINEDPANDYTVVVIVEGELE
ncbi:hypothetical protein DRN44_09250 [Thermococci archaeon]|nr:MAG: hypothetical protein DRN44_09250 [Thermococci archaeon]